MLPTIWGKYAWPFIHMVTLDYPENPTDADKKNYYNFFMSLQYVLPCAKCRKNMSQHLKKYPLTNEALANRASLVKWAIDLHNIVNYYTGKPMLSYEEAMNEINKMAEPDEAKSTDYIYIIFIIIALIIIIYLLYICIYRKKKLNY